MTENRDGWAPEEPAISEPAKEPEKKEPEAPKPSREVLLTSEGGQIVMGTIAQQLAYAQTLIAHQVISSTFKTPQQVVVGMQYCISLKLDVIVGLKMMYVVNGQPCLYGDGPLIMCRRTGLVEGFKEFYVNDDLVEISYANKNYMDLIYASVTRVKRKGEEEWQEDFFTQDELETAGLKVTRHGPKVVWQKYEKNMMRYKPRSMALKSKFADCLHGVGMTEYDHSFSPETPEVRVDRDRNPTIRDVNLEVLSL